MSWTDSLPQDLQGYFDGRDLDTPRPGLNRSSLYRHCWQVGRREKLGRNWPADKARRLAKVAEARDRAVYA